MGRCGEKPELRHTGNGKAATSFSVATESGYKDDSGEWKKVTDWHKVVSFGSQAESCAKYIPKGGRVLVNGRLTTRTWEKDGKKNYVTEVVADRVEFIDFVPKEAEQPSQQRKNDDDLPF